MVIYVPGTEEKDPKKVIMSLQQIGPATSTNTTNIATNTTNIATNTADIAAIKAAWTTYTPTVTASSGTFTTVSAAGSYLTIGKLVHFTCTITITTVGTAAGAIVLPLPVGTTARAASVFGLAHNLGKSVGYRLLNADTTGNISFYDNTSAIAAGNVIVVTGIYEQT